MTNAASGKKPSNSQRKKRFYKNKKKHKPKTKSEALLGPSKKPKRKNNHSHNKKVLKNSEIITKYYNLKEQYILARKKFFEHFFRKDKRRVQKLEKHLGRTLSELISFEKRLKTWQLETLEKTTELYPLDTQYSESTNEKKVLELPNAPYEDYHLKETQKQRSSFSEDTEVSTGTMEDYENYKKEVS